MDLLLIEPDAMAARLLRESIASMSSSQFKVRLSVNLSDTLELLGRQQPYAAILLSLSVPAAYDVELLARIQAVAPFTPVIILADSESDALEARATRFGPQDYVVKSKCDGRILSRIIRHAIERKRIEEALRQSEQRYKRLLASTTDYIYTVQVENGRSSPAVHGPGCVKVTGYSPLDYAADPLLWYRMIHVEDRPAAVRQIEQVLHGLDTAPLEHRIVHKDGSIRWIRNTAVPRLNERGEVISYDGLISDISERKMEEERRRTSEQGLLVANAELTRANAELSRSEDALRKALEELKRSHEELKAAQLQLIEAGKLECIGTLGAGVAHEVKNPLQTILMGLAYLEKSLEVADENVPLVITDMRDAIYRADAIVRDLLQFSSATQLEITDHDLNSVVKRSLKLVRYELIRAQVTVTEELGANLPPVRLDLPKMEQVFINLYLNAIQAMPDGGTLSIRTWAAASDDGQRRVVAEVQDSGPGIPEGCLSRVFDPFFTTKPPGVGTGLGLSVTKKIVELHGGTIDIQNLPQGGVRVRLTLKTDAADVKLECQNVK